MGFSTEFFGFRRCGNPPPVSLVGFRRAIARRNPTPDPRSIAEQWSGSEIS